MNKAKDVCGNKIEYSVKPKKIKIETRPIACCCENCANVGKVYIIHYNETDFRTLNGNIGKKRYAKPRQLWLCENCFNELKEEIENVAN